MRGEVVNAEYVSKLILKLNFTAFKIYFETYLITSSITRKKENRIPVKGKEDFVFFSIGPFSIKM